MRTDMRFDLRVRLLFGLDVLDNRFDHEIAVLQVGVAGRPFQISKRPVAIGGGHFALRHAVAEKLVDAAETLLQKLVVHFEHEGLEARGGGNLRDARAHQAATENADCFNRHSVLADLKVRAT
jgi:hypothetical protein